jgi:hypothetical protein
MRLRELMMVVLVSDDKDECEDALVVMGELRMSPCIIRAEDSVEVSDA